MDGKDKRWEEMKANFNSQLVMIAAALAGHQDTLGTSTAEKGEEVTAQV